MANKQTPWIDLSKYSMTLLVGVIDPPAAPLPPRILMLIGDADRHGEALTGLGFIREPNSGRWVHLGTPSLSVIQKAFPESEIIHNADMRQFARRLTSNEPAPTITQEQVKNPHEAKNNQPDAAPPSGTNATYDDKNVVQNFEPKITASKDATEAGLAQPSTTETKDEINTVSKNNNIKISPNGANNQDNIASIVHGAKFLGLNRVGQRVMDGPRGRFIQNEDGQKPILEGGNIPPGLFLRAPDMAQLNIAADGFVEEMVRGQINRFEDLRRFSSAIYETNVEPNDRRLIKAHQSIEAAILRWISRHGGKTKAEMFQAAIKLHDMHPYLGDIKRHIPDADLPIPAPISLVVQRSIGKDSDLENKKIVTANDPAIFINLTKKADISVYSSSQDEKEIALAMASFSGHNKDGVSLGQTDYSAADIVIAKMSPGKLENPREYENGLKITRSDIAELIDGLAVRSELGRTIVMIYDVESDNKELDVAREWIGRRYAIEGCADVGGVIHQGKPDSQTLRILVISRKRPWPLTETLDAAMQKDNISDLPSLWAWSSGLIFARAQIEEYHAELEQQEAQESSTLETEDSSLVKNEFQTPYAALSSVGTASTMVPKNLEGATRFALSTVSQKHQNFDKWVANELGMTTEQLGDRFSPEQIDAIALAIHAEERERGFLLADQTGVGKGRTLAALMLRTVLQGKKVLFLTERSINLSDIWRDIRHIGAEDSFYPLIINNNEAIVDEMTGQIVFRSQHRDYIMEKMVSNVWPEEHNIVIATYSQFSGDSEPRQRRRKRRNEGRQPGGDRINGVIGGEEQGNLIDEAGQPILDAQQEKKLRLQQSLAAYAQDGVSPKAKWLVSAPDKDTILFLDESHNAANFSNTGKNIQKAIDRAGGVVFSSATFAKEPKNMAIYAKLLPKGFAGAESLSEILTKGGETMQETLSFMLAKDGVMIRREHDLSKCWFETIEDEVNKPRNYEYMDKLASVLSEMAYLSGDVQKRINERNVLAEETIRREVEDERILDRRLNSIKLSNNSIGSALYLISRLFTCSLLINRATDEAVNALLNEQKPIILVENTVQSILQEMAENDNIEGRAPDFKDVLRRILNQLTKSSQGPRGNRVVIDISEETPKDKALSALGEIMKSKIDKTRIEVSENGSPKFKEELLRALEEAGNDMLVEFDEHLVTIVTADVSGIITNMDNDDGRAEMAIDNPSIVLPETIFRAFNRIRDMINNIPDMPASAIDAVRDGIERKSAELLAEGKIESTWRVEEITGRSFQCRNGEVTRRPPIKKIDIKNGFNFGEIDALIINVAGTTGIDLHAGSRFPDQRQRCLIVMQAPANIDRFIQGLGRVNRFDQVIGPRIVSLLAGLPLEMRLMAMHNVKLSRMSANTTSNRQHSAAIKDIPDIMNRVGDEVATRWAEQRPDLMKRLGFTVDEYANNANNVALNPNQQNNNDPNAVNNVDNKRSINQLLARAAMLPVAEQQNVIEQIFAEYKATVEELDSRGINPLKSPEIEGKVHKRERIIFDGAEAGDVASTFLAPVYAQKVIVEHDVEPLRGNQIMEMYERGLGQMQSDDVEGYADRIERNRDSILRAYIPPGLSVNEALALGSPRIIPVMNERLGKVINFLRNVRAGSGLTMTLDGIQEQGIIMRVVPPDPRNMHLAAHYDIRYVIPGATKILSSTLQTLLGDPAFAIDDGLNGDKLDSILSEFDNYLQGSRLEPRTILIGNEWLAMQLAIQHNLGNMSSWKDEDGIRHRGVIVSKRVNALEMLPVSLRGKGMVEAAIIECEVPVYGNPEMHGSGIYIIKKRDNIKVVMPARNSRRFGGIYDNEDAVNMITAYGGNPQGNGTIIINITERGHLSDIVSTLVDAGIRFYMTPTQRNWANRWLANNMNNANTNGNDEEPRAPRP